MQFGKGFHQRQAQARALGVLGGITSAGMLERLLDARKILRRHALAIIFHHHRNARLAERRPKA